MTVGLDVTKELTGKRILIVGVTGFVGKVTLSMLLHHYGEVLERVYVLVRKGTSKGARERFFDKVAASRPFEPLREKYGDNYLTWLTEKCIVLEGDISGPWAGLGQELGESLRGKIDAVLSCAGLVSFNPPLEVGLNVNTHGVRYLAEACLFWDVPLVHVSTAFVAGRRSGVIFEDEELKGYFPKRGELEAEFSLEQELADCEKLTARLREEADDKALSSTFRTRAVARLESMGRDPNDARTLRLAVGRERKLWLSTKLVDAGMQRSEQWGWPNTYTYTKSLGEQVLEATPGLRYAIARPSIVESSVHYPFPGWNEGFTTSAPLIYAMFNGYFSVPAGNNAILDMIPVDMVASGLIAILAQQFRVAERRVYHLASGDSAPFEAARSVELVGLYKRRRLRKKSRENGGGLLAELKSRIEPQALSERGFRLVSSPIVTKGGRWLAGLIDERRPTWGAPRLNAWLSQAKETLEEAADQASRLTAVVELFLPFCWDHRLICRCDNTRSLFLGMPAVDRAKLNWSPERIDWRTYFLETHIPGLEKHVFPGLDEETAKRKVIPAARDLCELLDASVHHFRSRGAFRMYEGDEVTTMSYGELRRYANSVATHLEHEGIAREARVMLLSENRPEWGVAFFGIILAGAVVVPVDKEANENEVVNIARRSDATMLLISDKQLEGRPGLIAALEQARLPIAVTSLAEAMATPPAPLAKKDVTPDALVSINFTSGTTANPKGVMLTHRNYTSLVAKLAGAFNLSEGDGVLSVLPLHHTFEFSAGFLTPLSRGAEVSYIDELNADRISEVLRTGSITALVGVPALWQLLHRRITQEMSSKPKLVEQVMRGLLSLNQNLREDRDLNFGKLFFMPVHKGLGGRLRVLVSGGSALPEEVQKDFHALGFNLDEGYGLAEAAPVLTVTNFGNKRLPGSVGKALPGIELRIDEPDGEGIGEVLARGPNVMAGYFLDREATDAVLREGWLHTGDLGRLDREGNLYLVGRKKDVIIDANGKNVYPDEVEELYSGHPRIKELSVVGLKDEAGGEKVACLCVPDYGDLPREDVRRELTEHFREVSSEQPYFRRIKVLRFWDLELPRTSTRKVKRPLVAEELRRLEKVAHAAESEHRAQESGGASIDWLAKLVAEVTQRPVSQIHGDTQLQTELGFDSLMFAELSAVLVTAGVPEDALKDLTQVSTLDELRKAIRLTRPAKAETATALAKPEKPSGALELDLPDSAVRLGAKILGAGQDALYRRWLEVSITGQTYIPKNRNVLVIANHASHLDMGLVKYALGEQGQRLVALAAKDYFFNTSLKRAYFENFTNLIPMDRKGSLRDSLRLAGESLNQGYHLLIFPEGTRTPNGEMQEFKPTTGYLSLTFGVDILPMYLGGTFDALPKGATLPRRGKLKVHIGAPLSVDYLRFKVKGLARSDRYRVVTAMAEAAVKGLREGKVILQEDLPVPVISTRRPAAAGGA